MECAQQRRCHTIGKTTAIASPRFLQLLFLACSVTLVAATPLDAEMLRPPSKDAAIANPALKFLDVTCVAPLGGHQLLVVDGGARKLYIVNHFAGTSARARADDGEHKHRHRRAAPTAPGTIFPSIFSALHLGGESNERFISAFTVALPADLHRPHSAVVIGGGPATTAATTSTSSSPIEMRLLISDSGSHRIFALDGALSQVVLTATTPSSSPPPPPPLMATVVVGGSGTRGLLDHHISSRGMLDTPQHLAFASATAEGRMLLYIHDAGNCRIRVVTATAAAAAAATHAPSLSTFAGSTCGPVDSNAFPLPLRQLRFQSLSGMRHVAAAAGAAGGGEARLFATFVGVHAVAVMRDGVAELLRAPASWRGFPVLLQSPSTEADDSTLFIVVGRLTRAELRFMKATDVLQPPSLAERAMSDSRSALLSTEGARPENCAALRHTGGDADANANVRMRGVLLCFGSAHGTRGGTFHDFFFEAKRPPEVSELHSRQPSIRLKHRRQQTLGKKSSSLRAATESTANAFQNGTGGDSSIAPSVITPIGIGKYGLQMISSTLPLNSSGATYDIAVALTLVMTWITVAEEHSAFFFLWRAALYCTMMFPVANTSHHLRVAAQWYPDEIKATVALASPLAFAASEVLWPPSEQRPPGAWLFGRSLTYDQFVDDGRFLCASLFAFAGLVLLFIIAVMIEPWMEFGQPDTLAWLILLALCRWLCFIMIVFYMSIQPPALFCAIKVLSRAGEGTDQSFGSEPRSEGSIQSAKVFAMVTSIFVPLLFFSINGILYSLAAKKKRLLFAFLVNPFADIDNVELQPLLIRVLIESCFVKLLRTLAVECVSTTLLSLFRASNTSIPIFIVLATSVLLNVGHPLPGPNVAYTGALEGRFSMHRLIALPTSACPNFEFLHLIILRSVRGESLFASIPFVLSDSAGQPSALQHGRSMCGAWLVMLLGFFALSFLLHLFSGIVLPWKNQRRRLAAAPPSGPPISLPSFTSGHGITTGSGGSCQQLAGTGLLEMSLLAPPTVDPLASTLLTAAAAARGRSALWGEVEEDDGSNKANEEALL